MPKVSARVLLLNKYFIPLHGQNGKIEMNKKKLVLYIDPQSTGNLAAYDFGVLSEVEGEVDYVCSRYYDYREMGPNVRMLPLFSYNRIGNPLLKLLSYLWSMGRLLVLTARLRPAVVHVQWLRVPHVDYMFYWIMKRLYGPAMVMTAHNVLPHNTGNRYRGIYGKVYRLFDRLIVHAEATRREIHDIFGIEEERISVIHHGTLRMDFDAEALKKQEAALRRKYPTEGKTVFTSLGEQSAYKGIDLLVDIWRSTPELNSNEALQIIFAGKNRGIDFTSLAACSNVTVADERISNEEFHYLLRETSVYLLPYRKISQSGALFTAIDEHVPLLVSDAGGLAEPLSVAPVGWKVKACDKESLRQMLLHLARNPQEIKAVKDDAEGWEKVCEAYRWDGISRQTYSLYKSLFMD